MDNPKEPHHGTDPSQGERDEDRQDAAGYDTQPPPSERGRSHPNLGNHEDPVPEREGWREFDANVEWQGDEAYPAGDAEPEDKADTIERRTTRTPSHPDR